MAKAMSALPWWKTSNVSGKPRAACAASLKAASKRCTTSFRSPIGVNCSPAGFLSIMVAPLKVGIAGLGTVGAEVVRLIETQARVLAGRCGRNVRVTAVTARSKAKKRGLDLQDVAWAKTPIDLAVDPDVDCFVELMGGAG